MSAESGRACGGDGDCNETLDATRLVNRRAFPDWIVTGALPDDPSPPTDQPSPPRTGYETIPLNAVTPPTEGTAKVELETSPPDSPNPPDHSPEPPAARTLDQIFIRVPGKHPGDPDRDISLAKHQIEQRRSWYALHPEWVELGQSHTPSAPPAPKPPEHELQRQGNVSQPAHPEHVRDVAPGARSNVRELTSKLAVSFRMTYRGLQEDAAAAKRRAPGRLARPRAWTIALSRYAVDGVIVPLFWGAQRVGSDALDSTVHAVRYSQPTAKFWQHVGGTAQRVGRFGDRLVHDRTTLLSDIWYNNLVFRPAVPYARHFAHAEPTTGDGSTMGPVERAILYGVPTRTASRRRHGVKEAEMAALNARIVTPMLLRQDQISAINAALEQQALNHSNPPTRGRVIPTAEIMIRDALLLLKPATYAMRKALEPIIDELLDLTYPERSTPMAWPLVAPAQAPSSGALNMPPYIAELLQRQGDYQLPDPVIRYTTATSDTSQPQGGARITRKLPATDTDGALIATSTHPQTPGATDPNLESSRMQLLVHGVLRGLRDVMRTEPVVSNRHYALLINDNAVRELADTLALAVNAQADSVAGSDAALFANGMSREYLTQLLVLAVTGQFDDSGSVHPDTLSAVVRGVLEHFVEAGRQIDAQQPDTVILPIPSDSTVYGDGYPVGAASALSPAELWGAFGLPSDPDRLRAVEQAWEQALALAEGADTTAPARATIHGTDSHERLVAAAQREARQQPSLETRILAHDALQELASHPELRGMISRMQDAYANDDGGLTMAVARSLQQSEEAIHAPANYERVLSDIEYGLREAHDRIFGESFAVVQRTVEDIKNGGVDAINRIVEEAVAHPSSWRRLDTILSHNQRLNELESRLWEQLLDDYQETYHIGGVDIAARHILALAWFVSDGLSDTVVAGAVSEVLRPLAEAQRFQREFHVAYGKPRGGGRQRPSRRRSKRT